MVGRIAGEALSRGKECWQDVEQRLPQGRRKGWSFLSEIEGWEGVEGEVEVEGRVEEEEVGEVARMDWTLRVYEVRKA